eukprot:6196711-Pleurochrysis_carterae.AAC.1
MIIKADSEVGSTSWETCIPRIVKTCLNEAHSCLIAARYSPAARQSKGNHCNYLPTLLLAARMMLIYARSRTHHRRRAYPRKHAARGVTTENFPAEKMRAWRVAARRSAGRSALQHSAAGYAPGGVVVTRASQRRATHLGHVVAA